MNRKVIIFGAGGHARVIADIVRANNDTIIGFLDDDSEKETIGTISEYNKYIDSEFVIGIGNTNVREYISSFPVKWYTAIHPSAVISPSVEIEEGTVVMPNAVINANSKIGKHCIVNSGAIIEHDNIIGNFVHVSVGAKLGGTVNIGIKSWIGIGATIINNISICEDAIIGAGAVVVKFILQPGTYIGVPAYRHKDNVV